MDSRATRGLGRLSGDTSGRASSTAATRRANATLDARARAWWLHGCSICAGTQMAGGDGPCRCRAPTRTRPTPTRKALPAARGVRPGCAWAYSAATITRHGSRAAILILGDSNWGRSFLKGVLELRTMLQKTPRRVLAFVEAVNVTKEAGASPPHVPLHMCACV